MFSTFQVNLPDVPPPVASSSPRTPNPASSPARNGPRGHLKTPVRTRIRTLHEGGLSYNDIRKRLWKHHNVRVSRSTISRIITSKRNRRLKLEGRQRIL